MLTPAVYPRNAPFELDSRIATWPGITLSIPLP